MARRHFDKKGHPNLDLIIKEIRDYVEGLEIEFGETNLTGYVVDNRNPKYSEEQLTFEVDLVHGISKKPFLVKAIYVVGGQVKYLPNSYNTGEHDLDLIVQTNAQRVSFDSEVEGSIWMNLANVLEDGKGCWTDRAKKEFALDLFDEDGRVNPLKPPYLQIYPTIKKTL